MHFSSLVNRISDASADAWEVHYRALARHAAGEDIIMLSVGEETAQPTSEVIVEAAVQSLRAGRHHYTPVEGTLRLRQAIAKRHNQLTGQGVGEQHCAVFSGAQNALFAVAQCVLQHGDEVIVIEPYYTTYPAALTASGATLVPVVARRENAFQIDADDVINAITDNTRAIVLNSPNNPMGAVYGKQQFAPLVKVCVERDIWLINDEVYQELLPPAERASPASIDGADKVCVTVSSLSKSHRMTGWRLGWVVAPQDLMKNLYNLAMCMAYGLPEFIMDAAVAAFADGETTAQQVRANIDRRRAILVNRLTSHVGDVATLDLYGLAGGMFMVMDVRPSGLSSIEFARRLLDEHAVSVLPCDGFGKSANGLVRISLCAEDHEFEVACDRIVEFIKGLLL